MFFKRNFALIIAVGLVLLPLCAPAQVTSATTRDLNFAILTVPSSGSEYIQVNATANNSYSGTGSVITGTPNRALYTVTNPPGTAYTVDLDINNVSVSDPTVTLTNFTGRWRTTNIASFPRFGLSMPANTTSNLFIGGRMTYTSGTPEGDVTMSFDIVITYN